VKQAVATFDDFLRGLQREVGLAQAALQKKHERLVRRYFDLQADGQLKAINWIVEIADANASDGVAMELPLLSLLPPTRHKVTEVSLEFAADIVENPVKSDSGRGALMVVIKKRHFWSKGGQRKIKVKLIGDQPGRVEVFLDGVLFKTVDGAQIVSELEG